VPIQRRALGISSVALCLALLGTAGLAQSPQPTFRSAVDLLTIETSVRDKSGQPVPDLQASDFTVTIDGRPRKVVSATFFKADPDGNRLSGGAPPTPRHVSNDASQHGRVVVFALDAETIRGGQERPLFETASRMIDALSPSDAVGLQEMPGPSIELTRDRSRVADALKRFRGRAPNAFEQMARAQNPEGMARADRAHAQQVLLDLAALVRRLAVVRAPRSVVLMTGGFDFDLELRTQYIELQHAAAESRVGLYTVLVEHAGYGVERGETRPDVADNPALTGGPATIASMTGGMFFSGVARGVGVFDRIRSEVTSFYQLALESSPEDADGKRRDLNVKVGRPGVDVRAASQVAVARPIKTTLPSDPLLRALQQPTDVPDVTLAVTTYSTHAAGGMIQLLVSAEVGAASAAPAAEWGLVVSQNGKDVAIRRGRFPAGSQSPRVVSTSVEVLPGDYRLRLAGVDAEDRIGVLEVPFKAEYQTVSTTKLSDLVVGVVAAGDLEPRGSIARSEELTAMLQVLADPGAVLGGRLQLVPAGSARAALSIALSIRPAASEGLPATLQARAPLAAVPSGRYTASAAVTLGGQPLARIDRVIEITGPAPVTIPTEVVAVPANDAARAAPPPPPVTVTAPATPSAGSPDDIMRRVGAYVQQYGGQASLLVAVEHYSQSMNGQPAGLPGAPVGMRGMAGNAPVDPVDFAIPTGLKRSLVSEFALVANASASGGWLGFRDVIEVDGKAVGTRSSRLQALFQSDSPNLAVARRIADESARYNIGSVKRNFNVPTTTLFFFHAGNLPRFTFRRTGRGRIEGVDTVVIDFSEQRTPTLTMTASGRDVPGSGTLWVNPVDGAVVRTRLEFRGFDDAGSRAVIDVAYRRDPKLGMWVPSRMTERYVGGTGDRTTTVATYQDFKRFQTSVKIK
jgi:VWFA-related protein